MSALESPAPEDRPKKCSALSKRGERCGAYALKGSDLCRGHGMSAEERAALTAASAAKRAERVEARTDAVEAARMGLRALMGARLEERADKIVTVLDGLLDSPDESIRLRAIEQWMSRVYGKAVQPTQDVSADMPTDLDQLRAMSPEERRALLRSLPEQ